MYKVMLVIVLAAAFFGLYAQQMDEEAAVQVFFQLKHSVNRAAHSAAQQIDLELLSIGRVVFDAGQARQAAEQYLRMNLNLDDQMSARVDGPLLGQVDIVVFELIDDSYTFPYRYVNDAYDYEVTLYKPGVILIIHAEYNRLFRAVAPIAWYVKGAAEIVR